jgi:hypothetical protein
VAGEAEGEPGQRYVDARRAEARLARWTSCIGDGEPTIGSCGVDTKNAYGILR